MEEKKKICINDLSNVNNLCRACLTKSKQMIQLDSNYQNKLEESDITIWYVLEHTMGIQITSDERYPSYICPMCLSLIRVCYKFKLQFENSQELLSNYFNESHPAIETLQHSSLSEVDLISNQGVYDLKEVFVVEEANDESPNFDGFLKNLGKEVSASFVNNHNINKDIVICDNSVEISVLDSNLCENDSVLCAICDETFFNKPDLIQHIKDVHKIRSDQFVNEACYSVKKSISDYCQNKPKKQYSCSECPKSYFNSPALQQHIAAIHKNNRVYLCTICGKDFNYSNALTYHMRIHTDERKYQCSYCGKLFRMQCGLNRHLRTHTGTRPYKCNYCDKAFRSKGEVDCHEMSHTGYRPYHCKYCGKGFTKTYNLKIHLLSHKGPHSCDVCNKTFIEHEFLKIHIESTHLRKINSDEYNGQ